MALVVLITGSSTGFGFLTAKQLAGQGRYVFAAMRETTGKNADRAAELRDFAAKGNYRLEIIDFDVTDEAAANRAVQHIREKAGRLDVLINNAGIWGPGVLEGFTLEQWHEVFDVNLFGSVRAARAALPVMREQKNGLIIQISSLQGRFILPYSGPYVASKWAVEAAMETLRYELAPHGVEVCIIEPYDFMTEMKDKARAHQPVDREREKGYGETIEMIKKMYLVPDPTRSGDPQEVVNAISKLFDTPAGKRPFRTTVKNPIAQIERINELSEEMHQGLFPYINLGDLLKLDIGGRTANT